MVSYNKRKNSDSNLTNYIFSFVTIIFSISFIFQFYLAIEGEKKETLSKVKSFISKRNSSYKNALSALDYKELKNELNQIQNMPSIQRVELVLDLKNKTIRSTFKLNQNSSLIKPLIPNIINAPLSDFNLSHNGTFVFFVKQNYIFKKISPHIKAELIEFILKVVFINLMILIIMKNVLFNPIKILSENLQKIDWASINCF